MDKTPGIRPRPGWWHMMDVASRHAFPGVLTVIVLLLLSAPLGIPGQAQLQPAWAMACIFFWSLYRPASMPAPLVFALGLLLDLLGQEPVGIQILALLLIHAAALKLRRTLTRSSFSIVWMVFIMLSAAFALTEWLLVSLLTWQLFPPWPGIFEWGVAAGIYPFVAVSLISLHRGLAAPERAT